MMDPCELSAHGDSWRVFAFDKTHSLGQVVDAWARGHRILELAAENLSLLTADPISFDTKWEVTSNLGLT